jgi:hypothetical protein
LHKYQRVIRNPWWYLYIIQSEQWFEEKQTLSVCSMKRTILLSCFKYYKYMQKLLLIYYIVMHQYIWTQEYKRWIDTRSFYWQKERKKRVRQTNKIIMTKKNRPKVWYKGEQTRMPQTSVRWTYRVGACNIVTQWII